MGCDGGTIPTRDELVKTKKKPEQLERDLQMFMKWKLCTLSQQPLQEPIVVCELGRMYNKEAIINYLLSKTGGQQPSTSSSEKLDASAVVDHLRSLKDVRELRLTKNPTYKDKVEAGNSGGFRDMNVAEFICPIVGLEMNGKYRFAVIFSCGCVFSERALKEVKTDACQGCGNPFQKSDVIYMNGTDEEIENYRLAMEERRAAIKAAKKQAKRDKLSGTMASTSSNPGSSLDSTRSVGAVAKRKAAAADAISTKQSLSGARGASSMNGHRNEIQKRPKTIQDDPRASTVLKSLFTTSKEAVKQPSGHWITYNPFYN